MSQELLGDEYGLDLSQNKLVPGGPEPKTITTIIIIIIIIIITIITITTIIIITDITTIIIIRTAACRLQRHLARERASDAGEAYRRFPKVRVSACLRDPRVQGAPARQDPTLRTSWRQSPAAL